ncbi:GtrA family protein [Rhodococcus sp. SORGH_AS_0301]|uniref:GtrA family protein n=1 Tax=Rhodococcus sp. SORGH_AS_0301 TaxID=3041780 RepID=UPI00278AC66E|nr:GtrA family protein [Rhodococcus sp. SORGH_AS_0301]MDQ1182417.1 putative flippase GtrA [Rhodococcus sp. SORGH_AS_0301]
MNDDITPGPVGRRESMVAAFPGVMRFAVVGVVNTTVYYGSYLLLRLVVPYIAAHLIAIVVAMVGSFLLNCYWTFRTPPTWRKFALFPLGNLVNYVVTTVGVVALVDGAGMDERIAPLVAAVVAIPFTFVLSKKILTRTPVPSAGTR